MSVQRQHRGSEGGGGGGGTPQASSALRNVGNLSNKGEIGALLDEFVKVFNCNASQRDQIASFIMAKSTMLDTNVESLVRRTSAKIAKRSETRARKFRETVEALRRRDDLPNADNVIQFIIRIASERSAEKLAQRNARLAEANAALRDGKMGELDSVAAAGIGTPASRSSTVLGGGSIRSGIHFGSSRTPVLHASATASSVSRSSTYSQLNTPEKFLPIEVKLTPKKSSVELTGRSKGRTVVCDKEMIRQLLAALLGLEGRYISRSGGVGDPLVVVKHYAVDDALQARVDSLLCIANAFSDIQRIQQRNKTDLLAKAFTLCLSEVIHDYIAIVSRLESQLTLSRDFVTPLLIQRELGDWQLRIQHLAYIAKEVIDAHDFVILNKIYIAYCCTPRDSPIWHSLKQILRTLLAVFHDSLRTWLIYGRLNQSNTDWMIVKEESVRAVTANNDIDDPWRNGYRLVKENIPAFFSGFPTLCHKILVIGKSMALMNAMEVSDHSMAERRHLFSTFDSLEYYYEAAMMQKFVLIVNGFYDRINAEVMRSVVIEFNLRAHAELVQKHFLMSDENFALTFYGQIIEETGGRMSELDSQKVCRALSTAKSVCQSWPPKFAQVARVDATCGLMEDEWGVVPSPRDSNGLPIVQLRYTASKPVAIIFNESAIERYQRAFSFIWTILCCDFQLAEVNEKFSLSLGNATRIFQEFYQLCHLFNAIFARMTQMLNVIRFHIVYNVVQVYTQRFNMELDDKSNDLDKLIRAHERCLAGLEEGLFLTEDCKDIRTLIASLCDLIFRAAQEYSKFDTEVANCVSAVQLTSSVWCGKDMSETARFEIEEDRIRLEETLQSLNSEYSVLARNINDKFVRQMRDLVDELLHQAEHTANLANLAMQLDFTGYYRGVGKVTTPVTG